jgi:uncharacterized membrane protein
MPTQRLAMTGAVSVCVLALLAGFLVKAVCAGPSTPGFPSPCYSDIKALYHIRRIDSGAIPYLNQFLEYPVLTGLYMWLSGWFAASEQAYLTVSAAGLAVAALATTVLLVRLAGARTIVWCAAPTFILCVFLNWDLLAVAAMVAALYAWQRSRFNEAGAWLGIGTALKLFPILLVPALFFDRWFVGHRREGLNSALVAMGIVAAVNLPVAMVAPHGWLETYRFHQLRGAELLSIWSWGLPDLPVATLNLVSGLLTLGSLAVVTLIGWYRAQTNGAFPFLAVAAASLCLTLLWQKVYSPQYILWVLPMLALLQFPNWLVATFLAIDLMLWLAVFAVGYPGIDLHTSRQIIALGVWARALGYAMIAAHALRLPPPPAPNIEYTSLASSRRYTETMGRAN